MTLGEFTFRPYQERAIADARAMVSTLRLHGKPPRVVIVCPCGGGKTVISSGLIAGALSKMKSALFMASGRQLIYQKSRTLAKAGIEHAILMAGEEEHWEPSSVWVCSKDTYTARALHSGKIERATHDGWIVDECHRATGGEWMAALPQDDRTPVIGLTATAAGPDGRGLDYFSGIVIAATYAELLDWGMLVPCRVCAPWAVDTRGVDRSSDGDWSWRQLEGRQKKLVGKVVETYIEKGERRTFAAFGQGVEHAIGLCHEFNKAGIPTAHIDAETPTAEREDTFRKLRSGELLGVTNFGVLTIGWDEPCVSCAILAYATDSIVKHLQVVGRVLRPFPGKTDALILDHGDNVRRHGWPTDDHEWSLNPDETVSEREAANHSRPKVEITCAKCGEMRKTGSVCPKCGYRRVRLGSMVVNEDGQLVEIKKPKVERLRDTDSLHNEWMRCLAIAAHQGRNFYVAKAIFTKKTGHRPDSMEPMPNHHQLGLPVGAVYSGFLFRKAKV